MDSQPGIVYVSLASPRYHAVRRNSSLESAASEGERSELSLGGASKSHSSWFMRPGSRRFLIVFASRLFRLRATFVRFPIADPSPTPHGVVFTNHQLKWPCGRFTVQRDPIRLMTSLLFAKPSRHLDLLVDRGFVVRANARSLLPSRLAALLRVDPMVALPCQ